MSWRERMAVARAEAHLSWVENNRDAAAAVYRSVRSNSRMLISKFAVTMLARREMADALGIPFFPERSCFDHYAWLGAAPIFAEIS